MIPTISPSKLHQHPVLVIITAITLLILLSLLHLHLMYPDLIIPGVSLLELGFGGGAKSIVEGISEAKGELLHGQQPVR